MMKSKEDLTPPPASQQAGSGPASPSQGSTQIDPESLRLYRLALESRWPYRHVFRHIAPVPPVFVYGSLMLPWVLARVLEHDATTAEVETVIGFMTPAILFGYSRAMVKYARTPTIVKKQGDFGSSASVQGLLIGSLSGVDMGNLEEYISLQNHERDIVEVEITNQAEDKRLVAAYVYVWKGRLSALGESDWDVLEYMKGARPGIMGMGHPTLETILGEYH